MEREDKIGRNSMIHIRNVEEDKTWVFKISCKQSHDKVRIKWKYKDKQSELLL